MLWIACVIPRRYRAPYHQPLPLTVRQHATESCAQVVARMAQWALQFTPCVTTHGQHHTLLLEVAASLRLWGGNTALLNRLSQSWRDFGWQPPDTVTMACAPTARHAQWLALYGGELSCPPELMPVLVSDAKSDTTLRMVSNNESLSTLPVSCIEELQPHLEV